MAERENKIFVSIVATIVCLILNGQVALSTNFVVGYDAGWSFSVHDWPNAKTFRAGDTLEFKYDPIMHNVLVVDENSYDSCSIPSGAKIYQSGDDKIKLEKGTTYFICGFPGHCANGMKIAITVS